MGSATVSASSGGTFTYEFGMFPLTQGGTEVTQIAAVEDYFDFNLQSAQFPRPTGPGSQGSGNPGTGSSGPNR